MYFVLLERYLHGLSKLKETKEIWRKTLTKKAIYSLYPHVPPQKAFGGVVSALNWSQKPWKNSQGYKVSILGGVLRLRVVAAPAEGDLEGQVIENAILPCRSNKLALFTSRMKRERLTKTLLSFPDSKNKGKWPCLWEAGCSGCPSETKILDKSYFIQMSAVSLQILRTY